MNDNEPAPTPVSELVDFLDGFFPERSELAAENIALRDSLQVADASTSISKAQLERTAGLIRGLKILGMAPFAIQVVAMITQVLSGWPMRDVAPMLLGMGLLSLTIVHFVERIFGHWKLGADLRYSFVPANSP